MINYNTFQSGINTNFSTQLNENSKFYSMMNPVYPINTNSLMEDYITYYTTFFPDYSINTQYMTSSSLGTMTNLNYSYPGFSGTNSTITYITPVWNVPTSKVKTYHNIDYDLYGIIDDCQSTSINSSLWSTYVSDTKSTITPSVEGIQMLSNSSGYETYAFLTMNNSYSIYNYKRIIVSFRVYANPNFNGSVCRGKLQLYDGSTDLDITSNTNNPRGNAASYVVILDIDSTNKLVYVTKYISLGNEFTYGDYGSGTSQQFRVDNSILSTTSLGSNVVLRFYTRRDYGESILKVKFIRYIKDSYTSTVNQYCSNDNGVTWTAGCICTATGSQVKTKLTGTISSGEGIQLKKYNQSWS